MLTTIVTTASGSNYVLGNGIDGTQRLVRLSDIRTADSGQTDMLLTGELVHPLALGEPVMFARADGSGTLRSTPVVSMRLSDAMAEVMAGTL